MATVRKRSIIICAEDTFAAATACRWAVDHLYREGDVIHLTYVVKSLKPPLEVFHSVPGTTFDFAQPGGHHEAAVIRAAEDAIRHRYLPILKTKMCPYELNLFAERADASAETVSNIILRNAEERDAALVVLAAHNKPTDRDRYEGAVGSVAAKILKKCVRPLALVHS